MKMKKSILLAVGMILLATLPGCGKKEEGVPASKDYIYRSEEFPGISDLADGNNILPAGDLFYVYGTTWKEDGSGSTMVVGQMDEAGTVLKTAEFPLENGAYYSNMAGNQEGDIFAVKTVYYVGEDSVGTEDIMPLDGLLRTAAEVQIAVGDTAVEEADTADEGDTTDGADTEADGGTADETGAVNDDDTANEVGVASDGEAVDEADAAADDEATEETAGEPDEAVTADTIAPAEEITTEQYFLVQLDMDGGEKWSVRLNDIGELNDGDYFYAGLLVPLPDSRLLVSVMDKYALFDTAGNYQGLFQFSGPGAENVQDGQGTFLPLADGRVLVYHYGEKGLTMQEVNMTTGTLGEAVALADGNYHYFYPGNGYDLLMYDEANLYGYNLGQEPVKLMNYLDSDMNISGFSGGIWSKVPEIFWSTVYDDTEGRNYLARFTKVPPEEVADKVGLTLATVGYVDWEVKARIVAFNKSSQKYRIHLAEYNTDYSMYNPENMNSEPSETGVDRLNADIASGKIPDIMQITTELPIQSYTHKGLFADLIPFIEQDEELEMTDLLPNVVEAYSVDGHLYQMVPHFSVSTVYAKTSLVGSEPGWSITEAQELLASKPEGTQLFDSMRRDTMLYFTMSIGGEQFVDWEQGTCSFDSEAFIAALEYIKTYPEDIDWGIYEDNPNYWTERESALRTEQVLAQMSTLADFEEYNRLKKVNFGEEITMIGFPTENGNGSSLESYLSFGMSAKSKNKEGVWEFLRYFLTEEYQDKIEYMFPVSQKALDKRATKAMEQFDEYGNENRPIYYLGGQEITIDPITAEEVEKVKNFIFSVTAVSDFNQELTMIVREEAAPYFAGQKSVQEVTDIIQSRARIYISENS